MLGWSLQMRLKFSKFIQKDCIKIMYRVIYTWGEYSNDMRDKELKQFSQQKLK